MYGTCAVKKLNIKNYCIFENYNYNDLIEYTEKYFNNYIEAFDFKEYDYIFIPYQYISNTEHRFIADYLIKELIIKNGYKYSTKIVYYEVYTTIADINYFEDITNYKDKKLMLLELHDDINSTANNFLGLNHYRGLISSFEYAEAFKIVSMNYYLKENNYYKKHKLEIYNKSRAIIHNNIINKIAWFISIRKLRDNFRERLLM